MRQTKDKIFENEEIADVPIVSQIPVSGKADEKTYSNEEINDLPVGLLEGTIPVSAGHTHDGINSEKVLEGTIIIGGTMKSAYSGARALFFPDANTGFQVINDAGNDVFKTIVGGTDVGDVIIGDYSGGQGAKYDKSAGTFDFKGELTAELGHIGGWNIDATRIYSDSDEIVLDSANKKIMVGATNPITIDGANKKIESDNYVSGYNGAGFHLDEDLLEVGNIACRGLIRTAVFQKDIISSVGGNFMVIDSDVLDVDMTAADNSTVTTKATTTFSVGDILRIKNGTNDEWFEVTAVNGAVYTCNRDKAGDYGAGANPAWKKGATIVNYKQSGDGGIFMTASESNAPYLSVFTHAGSPWSDLNTRLRIGNLNGYLGYTTDLYGIGIGDATHYLKYDPTNHLRISGEITASSFQTATSGERMEIGISVGGNVHNIMKYDASANVPVMLGGVGVNAEVAFRNYTATHITAIIEQTVAAAVGLYVDMGASATKAGISFSNVGSGYDIEGSSDKWHISKLGAAFFNAEMDLDSNKIVNVTDPTANQDAATKKYVDDSVSLEILLTAGEDILIRDAIFISDGTEEILIQNTEGSDSEMLSNPNAWYGQTFTTSKTAGKIINVILKIGKNGAAVTGNIVVSIRATSGGKPTGNNLVSKTVAQADLPLDNDWYTITWDTPLTVTPDTVYSVLINHATASAVNYDIWKRKNDGNPYEYGDWVYGDGAESWSTQNHDANFKITEVPIVGRIYKTDATYSNGRIDNFIGFASTAISKNASGNIQYTGIVSGFSGLSLGELYQCDTTDGEITIYGGGKKVGIAVSATKILIINI